VPRDDEVVHLVRGVEGGGVAHAEVDLLTSVFGFAAGSIDHLWREINPAHGVAQFCKSQGEKASPASHVQHACGCSTCETRKQI
jgi:hypothetical protein